METKDYATWVGKKFIFTIKTLTPPGQDTRDVPPFKIVGSVTSVIHDEKTETAFVEISTKHVYLHGRVFPIVKQVVMIERNKKAFLYFDSGRLIGNECFSGEFALTE